MNINISLIKIGERFRKDMGDLQPLADDIKELGQLQPIIVDSNYHLICGERRIKACEMLGLEKIKCEIRPTKDKDKVKCEFSENELRKNFSTSERVAILNSIGTKKLGDNQYNGSPNWVTQNEAAKQAGFGGKETARRAKKAINNGSPELIKKLDNKEISISAAAKVAEFNQEQQKLIIKRAFEGDIPIQTSIDRQKNDNIKEDCRDVMKEYVEITEYLWTKKEPGFAHLMRKFKISNQDVISIGRLMEINGIAKIENHQIISTQQSGSEQKEIEKDTKPAQVTKQKTQQSDNNEFNEYNKLYISAARYFFAYPDCSNDTLQEHLKITKKTTSELVETLEKNEVISKPNEHGGRYLGLMPVYRNPEPIQDPEPVPETGTTQNDEQQLKKNQNIANQMSSETNEWYTPDSIIEDVFQVLGDIDLDPCSDPNGNIAAKTVYTKEDDGLSKDWYGSVFMNPPYSGEALEWANKIISEPIDQAIVLVASNTDARYFHNLLDWCDSVCFVKGRLEFKPGIGQKGGRSTVRNVLFYKGTNSKAFFDYFEKYGSVLCLNYT